MLTVMSVIISDVLPLQHWKYIHLMFLYLYKQGFLSQKHPEPKTQLFYQQVLNGQVVKSTEWEGVWNKLAIS